MASAPELRTDRLVLRRWRDADRAPFAALNADPEVMAHFLRTLDPDESDALVDAMDARLADRGWGIWAVEVAASGAFVGFTGLREMPEDIPCYPALEVGWRLARQAWGHGYASEAARAAVGFAFERLGIDELVSQTSVGNVRSRRVMERLGMTYEPADDFLHPRMPEGHPERPQVLSRLRREA